MFSQVSVCLSTGGEVHHMHHGIDHMVGYVPPPDIRTRDLALPHATDTTGGHQWRPVFFFSPVC